MEEKSSNLHTYLDGACMLNNQCIKPRNCNSKNVLKKVGSYSVITFDGFNFNLILHTLKKHLRTYLFNKDNVPML